MANRFPLVRAHHAVIRNSTHRIRFGRFGADTLLVGNVGHRTESKYVLKSKTKSCPAMCLLGALALFVAAGSSVQAATGIAFESSKLSTNADQPAALAATRGTATYGGNTTGAPTWQRPFTVGDGSSGSCSLSGTGTAVPYLVKAFSVDTTGAYDIVSDQDYDGFLHLYENTFNALDQCVGLIALNDDGGPGSQILDFNLDAGTTYYLVTSGFANSSTGNFTNTISGPGEITLSGTASYSGNTTGAPTWQRPFTVGDGSSGSCSLSGTGTAVPYLVQAFTVDATGTYDIVSAQNYDGFLHLYENTFNALDQCVDLIALNDDGGPGSQILGFNLEAETVYFLVTSGFANSSAGNFTNTISGLGEVTLIVFADEIFQDRFE
ncbi:MAG: hypothetical protein ACXIUL_03735 [Wenzhouxiangella sp.]